jgi:6-pyruvoyltetrahydropterin/6-carboxytetrahydropterin synthase
MKLTRRVAFSSGHRYWLPSLTPEENKELFGRWASPYNHGHNYILDVTTEGEVNPDNGMVVNIKVIDEILQRNIVQQFDQRSINDEIPHFQTTPASLENIALYIWSQLQDLPEEAPLKKIRLEEMPTLWLELDEQQMTLTRTYEFAASHRLYNPALPDAENDDLFGKCANPAGHGHNYILEVTVTGKPDPKTGFITDLEQLDAQVNELVVDRYDHKNFNVDLPEFQGRMTTSEVIAQEIWDRLEGNLPATLKRVRLHETARNIFEVERAS